jgi:hypothetical protein
MNQGETVTAVVSQGIQVTFMFNLFDTYHEYLPYSTGISVYG